MKATLNSRTSHPEKAGDSGMAKRNSRATRFLLAASLFATGAVVTGFATTASAAAGAITGTVFRDINADGIRQALEVGAGGISVDIFDTANALIATTTTTADGTYSVTVPAAIGTEVRVEFAVPTGSFLKPGVALANGATNVQFVAVGSIDVNWAVQNPNDYCGSIASTKLATTCWRWGDQTSANRTLATWNYTTFDVPTVNLGADNHNLALAAEAPANKIGTTYGLGYNRSTGTLFAGSFYRRFAALHNRQTGTVYAVRNAGTASTAVDTQPWLDLNTLFGVGTAGDDMHPIGASGKLPPNGGGVLTGDQAAWFHDSESWPLVGKASLGDIEVTEDNQFLYIVNLADRQLYRASAVTRPTAAADVARVAIPTAPNCAADDSRPFGLGFHDGVGYVGVVCSAESTLLALGQPAIDAYAAVDRAESQGSRSEIDRAYTTFRTVLAPALAQLHAYVYSFDAMAMPTTAAAFTQQVDIDLNYERSSNREMWMPWTNNFSMTLLVNQNLWEQRWNEPVLSSFAFEGDTMYIGLRNRMGDRTSYPSGHPDPTYVRTYPNGYKEPHPAFNHEYGTRGGILRVCGGTTSWHLESNGICDGAIGNQYTPGPGGHLFFGRSSELTMGAIVHAPGAAEVVSTQMDPTTEYSNGTAMYLAGSLAPGSGMDTRLGNTGFTVYRTPTTNGATGDTFGKSNGLGDLEVLCDGSPVEIGNRVWNDDNDNGVQDPGERGIAGVPVDLISARGAVVKTVVTDANGTYLFSATDTPELSTRNPAHVGLTLRIKTNSPAIPAGLLPKEKVAGGSDRSDSDFAAYFPGRNEARSAPLQLDGGGPANHDLDFGFGATGVTPTTLYAITGDVWEDTNANAVHDGPDGSGDLVVELLDAAGRVVRTTSVAVRHYEFDTLTDTTYTIRFRSRPLLSEWSNCHAVADTSIDFDSCHSDVSDPTTTLTDVITLDATLPVPTAGERLVADHVLRHVDAGYFEPGPRVGTT
jgi:SdrD B-like domain